MKLRLAALALATLAAVPLAGCADGVYGGGPAYGPGPYSYDGYYDGAYGPIYDGYWGDDDYFYYRSGPDAHGFRRGDRAHFAHAAPGGGGNFQPMHGSFAPGSGMHMPHFGGGHGGGNRGH